MSIKILPACCELQAHNRLLALVGTSCEHQFHQGSFRLIQCMESSSVWRTTVAEMLLLNVSSTFARFQILRADNRLRTHKRVRALGGTVCAQHVHQGSNPVSSNFIRAHSSPDPASSNFTRAHSSLSSQALLLNCWTPLYYELTS